MNFGKILYGGDYNPEQWLAYPEILKKDIEYMKAAQINLVSIGIFSWAMLEPEEGTYDFSWLEERIETLYQNGISVFLAPHPEESQMDGGQISGNLPGGRKPRKRAVRRKA